MLIIVKEDSNMIEDEHAGISCSECGYTKQVSNEEDAMKLENEFEWFNGNVICPECGVSVGFEDYLEGE